MSAIRAPLLDYRDVTEVGNSQAINRIVSVRRRRNMTNHTLSAHFLKHRRQETPPI
jgi:hypothetical protein